MKKSKKFASFCAAILLMVSMSMVTVFAANGQLRKVEVYLSLNQRDVISEYTALSTGHCRYWGSNSTKDTVVYMIPRYRKAIGYTWHELPKMAMDPNGGTAYKVLNNPFANETDPNVFYAVRLNTAWLSDSCNAYATANLD